MKERKQKNKPNENPEHHDLTDPIPLEELKENANDEKHKHDQRDNSQRRFDYQDDPEAVELQKLIAEKGTSGVLQDICGIQPHEPLHGIVLIWRLLSHHP